MKKKSIKPFQQKHLYAGLTTKAKHVYKTYKEFYKDGCMFNGMGIFKRKSDYKTLLQEWGIQEITRIYDMLCKYDKNSIENY